MGESRSGVIFLSSCVCVCGIHGDVVDFYLLVHGGD